MLLTYEAHLAARAALGDLEHRALGFVDDFARLAASGSSALPTMPLPAVMSWRSTERSRTMSA
jgi:hypothetical protein